MKPKIDINNLYEFSTKGTTLGYQQPRPQKTEDKPLTVSEINSQLGGTIKRPDMGVLKSWEAKRHADKELLDVYKEITSAKCREVGQLSIEALKSQAELIREQLRIDVNHQYGALAERAVVGEMTVIRKLEATLEGGIDLLFGDRSNALERLEERYSNGELTERDYASELQRIFNRYEKLRDDFEKIVNQRGDTVRNAFRSNTRNYGEQ